MEKHVPDECNARRSHEACFSSFRSFPMSWCLWQTLFLAYGVNSWKLFLSKQQTAVNDVVKAFEENFQQSIIDEMFENRVSIVAHMRIYAMYVSGVLGSSNFTDTSQHA